MLKKLAYILYQPYKFLFFIPFFFVITIVFGILAVIFSLLFNQRVGSYVGGEIWSKVICFFTPIIVNVKGKENMDKKQSYIIVPNHQSNYDIFALYGFIGLDIRWIMKKELRKIPGLGIGSEKVGHIFLDRSNARAAAKSLEEAKQKLTGGTSVVVFPEGTRSDSTNLLPFKRGAFKLALDLNLPLLPVTIRGTSKVMPGRSKTNIMPGKAKLQIHKPISIENYSETNIKELMEKVREVLENGLKE